MQGVWVGLGLPLRDGGDVDGGAADAGDERGGVGSGEGVKGGAGEPRGLVQFVGGRRVGVQEALGQADGPDVQALVPPHPVCIAQDEFGAAATDVEDEQEGVGGDIQGGVGPDGGVGELRFAVAADDLDVHVGARLRLGDEVRTIGCVAQGARPRAQDGPGALLPGLGGEAGDGIERPGHGGVSQALRSVHALAQTGDIRLLGDDGKRAAV